MSAYPWRVGVKRLLQVIYAMAAFSEATVNHRNGFVDCDWYGGLRSNLGLFFLIWRYDRR